MAASKSNSPWISCQNPEKAFQGYTLFTPMAGTVVWLVDMQGQPVHCWETEYPVMPYAVLLKNGNLLYCGTDFSGSKKGNNKVLMEVDWYGHKVWEFWNNNQHHAFFRMDNGNTMYLGHGNIPKEISARVKGGLPETEKNGIMRACSFHEVSPAGKIIWEWYAYEHLDPKVDILCPLEVREEWTHGNSCFVLPNGDVMTTFRRIDTLAIIDRQTGDIKWRWGVGELAHPHDVSLLDNGNMLVFDNGQHRRGSGQSYSRVVEVNPKTGKIEWEYTEQRLSDFYSFFAGGCQRLPNRNTLICDTVGGRFFEVTQDKEKVWEYVNPFYVRGVREDERDLNRRVFRAYRYSPDYPGLQGRVLNPDLVETTLRRKPASVRIV